MTHLDTDELAALFAAYGTPAEQAQMHRQIRIHRGDLCPECGAGTAEIEGNGRPGAETEFRCCACDHRWEPAEVRITTPAAAPVTEADLDVEAMFPTPALPPTRRSRDARVAHTTNKRSW